MGYNLVRNLEYRNLGYNLVENLGRYGNLGYTFGKHRAYWNSCDNMNNNLGYLTLGNNLGFVNVGNNLSKNLRYEKLGCNLVKNLGCVRSWL